MEKPHKGLDVWNKAVDLSILVYNVTEKFPKSELYGLVSQMRRCAVSVPSNIAEGAARRSRKEFLQFINVSRGSLSELDTQVEIAFRLGYVSDDDKSELESLMSDVDKMLYGLMKRLG